MSKSDNGLVEVYIPRDSANQDPNYFCAVNGVSYLLPRGKKSMVPAHVAAEILRAQAAEEKMYEERDRLKGQLPDLDKKAAR